MGYPLKKYGKSESESESSVEHAPSSEVWPEWSEGGEELYNEIFSFGPMPNGPRPKD